MKVKKISKKSAYLREVEIRLKKKRIKSDSPIGESITDSKVIYQIFKDLENEAKEKLIVISVDTQLKILCFEVVAIGRLNALAMRPIDILRGIVHVVPYGIVFVYNHLSGNLEPSPSDKKFIKKMKKYVADLGVYFLDHIIIGDDIYFSFLDKGLLDCKVIK